MLTLAVLWTGWCILHSLLITRIVADWFKRRGGIRLGLYRIGYIVFSLLSLIPVLLYQFSLPEQLLVPWSGPLRIIQVVLLLYALVLFRGGTSIYDMDYFLGLRQWRDYRKGQQTPELPFRCSGILQYVRHPWYSGGIALLWGLGPITDVTLVSRSILSLYLVIGTLLEERKLKEQLGEEYEHYCQKVPMLIPWKGKVELT